MTKVWDTSLPHLLSEFHRLEFDYADGEGIDYEPFSAFLPPDETAEWFKAWTGNQNADGSVFRVFGQDGTGGYAAFWLADSGNPVTEQPIVFLGSEGETGVVASNLDEYLWLFAGGIGPYEAVAYSDLKGKPNTAFTLFAEEHSPLKPLQPNQIVTRARTAFPNFSDWVESQCA